MFLIYLDELNSKLKAGQEYFEDIDSYIEKYKEE
jgi:hypothetical protein